MSWWPLALADPALFHVSLQTASLDDELMANKGFPISEVLMADSVSLIRKKIEDPIMALQDATMDSVVTLAAIEVRILSIFFTIKLLLTDCDFSTEKEILKSVRCISMELKGW